MLGEQHGGQGFSGNEPPCSLPAVRGCEHSAHNPMRPLVSKPACDHKVCKCGGMMGVVLVA